MGALAEGETHVGGFLEGEDSLCTLNAFRDMGVEIDYKPGNSIARNAENPGGTLHIKGVGLGGLKAPDSALDLGNSGTGMRLIAGVLAGQSFQSEVVGDESLHARPMGRIIKPLTQMGARIEGNEEDKPPLKVGAVDTTKLQAISYTLPVASAQIKSCLLFAGLYAEGVTEIVEPGITRDHTERMLRGFGVDVETGVDEASGKGRVRLQGGQRLTGTSIEVPADISSAAFFIVAASIAPGSDVRLLHVGVNPTRTGIIDVLKLMGADIELENEKLVGGEPVADIHVRYRGLKGADIPAELVPLAIDEFPALFVAACCADGITRFQGAEELRVKETDRIAAMVAGLETLGADIEELKDGAVITGGKPLGSGTVKSFGDHRIAMSFAISALAAAGPVEILDCDNVNTSFPGFVSIASNAGLAIEVSSGVAL